MKLLSSVNLSQSGEKASTFTQLCRHLDVQDHLYTSEADKWEHQSPANCWRLWSSSDSGTGPFTGWKCPRRPDLGAKFNFEVQTGPDGGISMGLQWSERVKLQPWAGGREQVRRKRVEPFEMRHLYVRDLQEQVCSQALADLEHSKSQGAASPIICSEESGGQKIWCWYTRTGVNLSSKARLDAWNLCLHTHTHTHS